MIGSSRLYPLLEMAYWLIRLRSANECFILNNTNLAAMFAKERPDDFQDLKATLPTWTLFYTVAGYEYPGGKGRLSDQRHHGNHAAAGSGSEEGGWRRLCR